MTEVDKQTGGLFDHYDPRDKPLYHAGEVAVIKASARVPAAAAAPPPAAPPPPPPAAPVAAAPPPAAGGSEKFVLPDLPPVYDQGDIKSGGANACCAALRYAWKKYSGKKYDEFQPSRLFAYYYGRTTPDTLDLDLNGNDSFVSDNIKKDCGTWNRAVLNSFLTRGVCKEELWPYGTPTTDEDDLYFIDLDTSPNPTEPPKGNWAKVELQAKGFSQPNDGKALSGQPGMIPQAISYYRILDTSKPAVANLKAKPVSAWANETKPTIQLLEQTLRSGFPFIFCTITFHTARFRKMDVTNGYYKTPAEAGTLKAKGAHAMMAVGFDQKKKLFLVQNSWGDYYGHTVDNTGGRFWMPYEWFDLSFDGRPVVSDYWVIKYTPAK
jgi:hypothetical protein